jgi:hypothetical protein
MKVNREKFFVLVAALAAGCRDVGPPPEAPERWSPASSSPGETVPARPRPAPHAEGSHAVSPVSSASEGDGEDGLDPFAEKIVGERCNPWLNMHGFPRSCAPLAPPGPACEGFGSTKEECAGIETHLKPRIAAKAIDCVLAKSKSPDLCSRNISGLCEYEALASACLEPEAAPVCAGIVAGCADDPHAHVVQAACEAAWSALRESERPKFVACMTEGCHFGSCLPFP